MRRTAAIDRLVGLRSFTGRFRVLHLTWEAFFLTFMVWFSFAPFAATIGRQLGLDRTELATLALCNVGLTVPARLLVGMALDRWGPRRVYAAILVYASVPCTVFALATTLPVMVASRLALSVVGGSFVVGIRMVAEWFAPREVGMAEGVYAGWGNAGAAAAALLLPTLAAILGGDDGWRWATGLTGVLALAYGLYYLRAVRDTPDGTPPATPRRQGALAGSTLAAQPALARNTGLRVHVSGCPNSCAQHQIVDLGFSGGKVTVGGKPVLGYQVWLGGDVPGRVFARVVGRVAETDVPAITEAIVGIWEALRRHGETLSQTVNRLCLDAFKAHLDTVCTGRWAPGPEPEADDPAADRALPLVRSA